MSGLIAENTTKLLQLLEDPYSAMFGTVEWRFNTEFEEGQTTVPLDGTPVRMTALHPMFIKFDDDRTMHVVLESCHSILNVDVSCAVYESHECEEWSHDVTPYTTELFGSSAYRFLYVKPRSVGPAYRVLITTTVDAERNLLFLEGIQEEINRLEALFLTEARENAGDYLRQLLQEYENEERHSRKAVKLSSLITYIPRYTVFSQQSN